MQSLFYFCITFLSVGAVCLDGHAYTINISAAFFPVQKSGFEVLKLRRRYKSQRIQCSATVWCCVWWWFCRKYHKYMCLLLVYQTNHQLSWYIQHTPPKWILFVGKGKHRSHVGRFVANILCKQQQPHQEFIYIFWSTAFYLNFLSANASPEVYVLLNNMCFSILRSVSLSSPRALM